MNSASRVAPSGVSLDVDDVAGETDQDRGEGRAPCPAGGLPDGGLTPAGRKSREGKVLEATLCLRLVENRR